MTDAKDSNKKSKEGIGWFCVVLGIFVLGMSSRIFVPVLQAMIGPRTGSSGTTIGMGMMIGMPFFIIGGGFLASGWILVLAKKTKIHALFFIIASVFAMSIFSTLVWHASRMPHRSPLTQAIEKYSSYTLNELGDELKQEIGHYEKTKAMGFLIGRSRVKIQALMQLLTDKHPIQAKSILLEISRHSTDEKIRKLAATSLLWIKDSGEQKNA